MNYMPAAWLFRKARNAQEQWNRAHPDRILPWEWVEEMILAWRAWKEQRGETPEEVRQFQYRYEEFARKVPNQVYEAIFDPKENRSA